jgi:actin-related protein 6
MKPVLKMPGTTLLTLRSDGLLSNFGFKFNLRRFMKELVSYRQWNMMDEYVLMDDVKEKLCYVPMHAKAELKRAKVRGAANQINKEYVLPDGVHVLRGYVKAGAAKDPDAESDDDDDEDDDGRRKKKKASGGGGKRKRSIGAAGGGGKGGADSQCLAMGNERFMVPEALFHPSDIGLRQAGVAEVVTQAVSVRLIKCCPPRHPPHVHPRFLR